MTTAEQPIGAPMKLDPQPGDIVHVRARVCEAGTIVECDALGRQLPMCRFGDISFVAKEILAIEPRPLKVGDRVRWKSALCHWQSGILKAIDENQTGWIRDAFGCYSTILLAALTKEP